MWSKKCACAHFDDDGEIACRRIAADIKDRSSSVNHFTDKEKYSTLRRVRGQRNTEWEETTYESCSDKVAPERHAPRRRGYNARRLRAVTTAYGTLEHGPVLRADDVVRAGEDFVERAGLDAVPELEVVEVGDVHAVAPVVVKPDMVSKKAAATRG